VADKSIEDDDDSHCFSARNCCVIMTKSDSNNWLLCWISNIQSTNNFRRYNDREIVVRLCQNESARCSNILQKWCSSKFGLLFWHSLIRDVFRAKYFCVFYFYWYSVPTKLHSDRLLFLQILENHSLGFFLFRSNHYKDVRRVSLINAAYWLCKQAKNARHDYCR